MLGFITDDNNDLMLDQLGNIRMEEGLEAYRQNLVNSIRLQQYEYGYDLSQGLNYMGFVLGERVSVQAWESQMFDMLKKKPFVKSIVEWATDIEGNNFVFKLVVETDLGEIEIKG